VLCVRARRQEAACGGLDRGRGHRRMPDWLRSPGRALTAVHRWMDREIVSRDQSTWFGQLYLVVLLWTLTVVAFSGSHAFTSLVLCMAASVTSVATVQYSSVVVFKALGGRSALCCRITLAVSVWCAFAFVALLLFDHAFAEDNIHDVKLPKLETGPKLLVQTRVRPNDLILIGNGPLSMQQRYRLIRSARPEQVYRINGLANLHPGEPLGHVFVRLIKPEGAEPMLGMPAWNKTGVPWYYWGLEPPTRLNSVHLSLPVFRYTYSHCRRLPTEALSVSLVNGRQEDAEWYTHQLRIPVTVMPCKGICLVPPAARNGWTTGMRALLHLLALAEERDKKAGMPSQRDLQQVPSTGTRNSSKRKLLWSKQRIRIHVFGMNWADIQSQKGSHFRETEKRLVLESLAASGRIVVHPTPTLSYHARVNVSHMGIQGEWVQGISCSTWTPWFTPIGEWPPPYLLESVLGIAIAGTLVAVWLWRVWGPYGSSPAHESLMITGAGLAVMIFVAVVTAMMTALELLRFGIAVVVAMMVSIGKFFTSLSFSVVS